MIQHIGSLSQQKLCVGKNTYSAKALCEET